MAEAKPTVLIIDDDPAIRGSLSRLLRSVGLDAQLFESIPDFLQAEHPNGPSCLVLDVNLPGQSGLDLQREWSRPIDRFPSSSSPVTAIFP